MDGSVTPSASRSMLGSRPLALLFLGALLSSGFVAAQELYKYRDDSGEWIYSDRPPPDGRTVEVRGLTKRVSETVVDVSHRFVGTTVELTARNDYYAPVELSLDIKTIRGMTYPDPEQQFVWILPARSKTALLQLELLQDASAPFLEYSYRHLPGDPQARHDRSQLYRAPFAISNSYPISQAFPVAATHTTPDSIYAVDIVMPVGTDVVVARGGVVFDTASTNFRAGQDAERDGPAANVVRILHDDGTYAIYAHLNTNTIRVRPGDRVARGEYIADSGNTGFSTGPHLHFVVVRNAGLRVESVPVSFMGVNTSSVEPRVGETLTAY